ncbi:hypothetical protein GP486_008523 [Trichoglossum hirsutum]|uniref:EXPERA domain-containing protein n=1 Tax=Trichoglossum hirsutum TaxID=265104 RepID=A0A9P8IAZ3_9PEZI|nr:hypothetical protein GP486_008523 [Trichoglossum hirsutum]
MAVDAPSTLVIDTTTVVSLFCTFLILVAAYGAARRVLPADTAPKLRVLFVWHLFDALIHSTYEASYLYNCFFTYADGLPNPTNFLNHPNRAYGAAYGSSPTAKLWQEYGKADKRWMYADLSTISLELLTVFGAGPLAAWICWLIAKGDRTGKLWFLCVVLATAELYGGFMTFCPEWLSGSQNLDTSNFMYLWVYLFFFNMLWVFIPFWILYEAHGQISRAFKSSSGYYSNNTNRQGAAAKKAL